MVPAAAEARAEGVRPEGGERRRAARRSGRSRSSLNLTVPKAHVEVGLRALDAGKHVYSEKPLARHASRTARSSSTARARKRLARRLRAGHVPRRRAPDLPQADRRRQDRRARRRHRLLHVPRPRALAPERRTSTTRSAAARCSTWRPTTSPTSSTCSARWRASPAMTSMPRTTRTITVEAALRADDPGRGRDPCRRHAGIRLRRAGADRA